MTAPAAFSSALAPIFERYVNLKRALGRRFETATWTLQSLDRLLHKESGAYPDMSTAAFQAWPDPREGCVGCSTGPHAGGLQLLPLSPAD